MNTHAFSPSSCAYKLHLLMTEKATYDQRRIGLVASAFSKLKQFTPHQLGRRTTCCQKRR